MTHITPLMISLFENEILVLPKNSQRALGMHLTYDKALKLFENLNIVQNFKPDADELKHNDLNIIHKLEQKINYSIAFCALPKQKIAAQHDLANALNVLDKNGKLIACAANDAGGKRLEKWFKEFGLKPQSQSKSKCRIVWATKSEINQNVINETINKGDFQTVHLKDQEWLTKPGIFGWNKIDVGSALLIETLPALKGNGADFGGGYGFLTKIMLQNNDAIQKIYAMDADYNALQCMIENCNNLGDRVKSIWQDLTVKPSLPPLDFIVMNPPFHEGKKVDDKIGQKFIESAAQSLKKLGWLYMVANAHLPYEKFLNNFFTTVTKIEEKNGFKVYHAQK